MFSKFLGPLVAVPRWAWIAAGAVALLAGLLIWHHNAVRRAVSADRAEAAAQASGKALEAERAAESTTEAIRAVDRAADADNRKAIDDAAKANPEEARHGVGPAVRSVTDRLRARQSDAGPSPGGTR